MTCEGCTCTILKIGWKKCAMLLRLGLNLCELMNMGSPAMHVFEICTFHCPGKSAPVSTQGGTTGESIALCFHPMVTLACKVRLV